MNNTIDLINKLYKTHSLTVDEYEFLLKNKDNESEEYIRRKAVEIRKSVYGNKVYIRGLIEISNICKNNCLYCGIRKGNTQCERYRLLPDEIFSCCEAGYSLGFRTFVLQGGEDGYFNDNVLTDLIKRIKKSFPDCAVTLSLGERSRESFERLYDAGADRYLLRHEAVNEKLYRSLHPENMSLKNRIDCLKNLKEIGFQTGCGFMVGAPGQTYRHLAEDLKFIEEFSPHMCGIGPFIPHKATVFKDSFAGSSELTCFLISVIRLIKPVILLPATTALSTLSSDGRERGILSGANVVMPNLSPKTVRKKYDLYDNKLSTGVESGDQIIYLNKIFEKIGYEIEVSRGDIKK